MADELTPAQIADDALNPAAHSGDGQSTTEVSIRDKIEAAKFAAANPTGRRRARRIRMMRVIPPDATGQQGC